MIRKVEMTGRQVELLNAAHKAVEESREKRDLLLLLEGMASGMEGKLLDANTDQKTFSLEVPDIEDKKEA